MEPYYHMYPHPPSSMPKQATTTTTTAKPVKAAKSAKTEKLSPEENKVKTVSSKKDESAPAKKDKKKKDAQATTATTETTGTTATTGTTGTTGTTDAAADEGPISEQLHEEGGEFLKSVTLMQSELSSIKNKFRALEKQWTRKLRAAEKLNEKKKRKSGNRKPSGFLSPTLISDELADFLAIPHGSVISRVEATRQITTYIKANNLGTGSNIHADVKLANLLHVDKTQPFTYFLLQKLMTRHYKRKGVEFPACTAAPLA